jgi:glutathione S-transferase
VRPEYFHLALPADWERATTTGTYPYSTRQMSYELVGFVHCAHREQLDGVANRFYADCPRLYVVVLDTETLIGLGLRIIEEPAVERATELFPHLYGPLPLAAVRAVHQWAIGADGIYRDPPI